MKKNITIKIAMLTLMGASPWITSYAFGAESSTYARSTSNSEQASASEHSKLSESQIRGMPVFDKSGQNKVGEVADVAIDKKSGDLKAILIETDSGAVPGHFAGYLIDVQPQDLSYQAGASNFKLKVDKNELTKVQLSSNDSSTIRGMDLLRMDILNDKNNNLGAINDFVINLNSNKVTHVVVDASLQDGSNKLVALPMDRIQFTSDNRAVVANLTNDQLGKAPRFDRQQLAANPNWERDVYVFYEFIPVYVEPSGSENSNRSSSKTSDNSKVNSPTMSHSETNSNQRSIANP